MSLLSRKRRARPLLFGERRHPRRRKASGHDAGLGDHVHAVSHSSTGDFGDDLLARHWRSEHAYASLVTGAAGK